MRTLDTLTREGFVSVIIERDDKSVRFTADGDINGDGSPHVYHPDGIGTDFNENGKDLAGRWVGVLTDKHGNPLIQQADDLAPGYYISSTKYEWVDQPPSTQRRYVNGEVIPHVTVPPLIIDRVAGIVMGCTCTVRNKDKGGRD